MKKVIITQSNYIPWKGYFDSMALVDEFILYDNVQYTKRDWRNRNLIKTPQGLKWLTIPVEVKGRFHQRIRDVKISDRRWVKNHIATIRHNYSGAQYFKDVFPFLEDLYIQAEKLLYLTEVNFIFLEKISTYLGITTPIHYDCQYPHQSRDKNFRLIEICQLAGATDYYSGPAAQNYLDVPLFKEYNIQVHWLDYTGYPEYIQLYPPFEHGVSIIDLVLNTGNEAPKYLKHTHYAKA